MTVSLDKRTEQARAALVGLVKRQATSGLLLGDLSVRVELAIDFSVSMERRYRAGEVQAVVERALALSLSGFADERRVRVHFFADDPYPAETVDADNFVGFVDRWAAGHEMSGTNYARTIGQIMPVERRGAFGRVKSVPDLAAEKDAPPRLVLFVTDGQPADRDRTRELLAAASARPYFWQFVGLGYDPVFLTELDAPRADGIDNVGVLRFEDTLAMSDKEFFDAIVRAFFTSWLPAARRRGITRR